MRRGAAPLRIRVTLAFTVASAIVLLALGLFLHARLRSELDNSLQSGLRQRLADLVALTQEGGADGLGQSGLIERGDDVAQVLDARGVIVAAAPGFERTPLLTDPQRRRAATGPVSAVTAAPHDEGQLALQAAPAGSRIVVVGASLEDHNEALASLDALLVLGLPIALLLAATAGYVVAGSALRPIDRLRARADAIGADDLEQRLPVPAARDEVRLLAETLNGMLDRLEEAFSRERAFVADASHELRTPLARLKAELELAARKGRSVGELEDAVRSAAAETDRLVFLAEDLLVLARSDRGRLPLRAETIDVAELLEETRRRYAPEATVDVPAGLELVGDRLRLQQALGNLVDNARRHGRGTVHLRAEVEAGGVGLHVEDDGGGIPDALRERAFERFTRGDQARDPSGGAGLGLAIVAAVAEAHGGHAGISEGGKSDVWMRLPA
jgi:heavy metal sensor kinase